MYRKKISGFWRWLKFCSILPINDLSNYLKNDATAVHLIWCLVQFLQAKCDILNFSYSNFLHNLQMNASHRFFESSEAFK